MQPSEFWSLSLTEFWWEFEEKHKETRRNQKGTGGLSQAEWDEAWRKHKAKQNG